MSETTPLLPSQTTVQRHHANSGDVYDRFPRRQKHIILTIISLTGLIAPFASFCFVPCIPQVAKELNTDGTIINYTVGVYVLTIAVGNLIWAPYAGFYGRRPIYLISLPLLCVGSSVASLSTSVFQLLISRTVQAFGASCFMSVGAATVSDIYRLEERGTAMGIFFGVFLLGTALAPPVGGLVATYASWRVVQLIVFSTGLAAFIALVIFLPETCHPGSRGMDRVIANETINRLDPKISTRDWRWVWLNPFRSLALLRGPNMLLVAFAGAFILFTLYVIMIPLSYTIGPRYGIATPALVGMCFLPLGVGNMVGAVLAGRLSDYAVTSGLKRRNGAWVPEDRLVASLPGALLLVPISLLVFGLTTQFVPGKVGLAINLVCLFIFGLGVDVVLSPAATYSVDILRTQSAESVAINNFLKNVFGAVASAGVLPVVNKVGIGVTNALAAILAWIAFVLLCLTIRYGNRMRAWLDVGYTSSLQES